MNCSACHTREIEVEAFPTGSMVVPASSISKAFADLDKVVNTVLTDQQAFADFARAVLGPTPGAEEKAKLRKAVQAWHLPYHTLMKGARRASLWGPARLDVSMIFNRLTGLDIGPPPTYMIPENIKPATAPVRYPFLWNAPIQDKTQWPGFADNGNNILGLARNLGEVYGVFGAFHPKKDSWRLLGIDYLHQNSANFQGLNALEDLVRKIGAPKWPWKIDRALATKGKAIFARKTEQGGCADCHGINPARPVSRPKTPGYTHPGRRHRLARIQRAKLDRQDGGARRREDTVPCRTAQTGRYRFQRAGNIGDRLHPSALRAGTAEGG